jgi:hypothetical protein
MLATAKTALVPAARRSGGSDGWIETRHSGSHPVLVKGMSSGYGLTLMVWISALRLRPGSSESRRIFLPELRELPHLPMCLLRIEPLRTMRSATAIVLCVH